MISTLRPWSALRVENDAGNFQSVKLGFEMVKGFRRRRTVGDSSSNSSWIQGGTVAGTGWHIMPIFVCLLRRVTSFKEALRIQPFTSSLCPTFTELLYVPDKRNFHIE